MSLDDLLGLLFLLFFIVIPALQGLTRKAPPVPPGVPEDLPPPEAPPRPRPKARPKAKPKPAPPPPPPAPGREGDSLERLPSPERTPLEVRFRETPPEEAPPKARRKGLVQTDREGLLKGVIWHEILKKPKGW
ncbi:hypothetical protein [Thermus sp.]|uniref:hypothetical protein n=1 Tax=Thermus sp. TaxID=275 RepID=UPI0025D1CF5B|nr:hypothetical protein [Thermus sp.]MCS6868056.1 hypothetical protein [Thermus sp.]MDW8356918.1 hypothetical protein [Thermus sp.]